MDLTADRPTFEMAQLVMVFTCGAKYKQTISISVISNDVGSAADRLCNSFRTKNRIICLYPLHK